MTARRISKYRPKGPVTMEMIEGFCRKDKKTGCWIWKKGKSHYGYGVIQIERRATPVHRLVWWLAFGDIPDGKLVCHKCDNPPCCNPGHLFTGTHFDNAMDAKSKGRFPSGTKRVNSKLTKAMVKRIRRINGRISDYVLGRKMGVSHTTIRFARKSLSYTSV